ncbi:hypothetical protein B566_EDAN012526 [Ephemera danica]|nr:hypothetical protein B566_EDAN012526 [Ephemera danica]
MYSSLVVSDNVNNATSSVSLHEGVRSLDNISVAALTLFLVVSGQSISDGVGVRVLRVGVVVSVDGNSSLGNQWGSGVGSHSGGSSVAQRRDDSSAGNSHEGGENDELFFPGHIVKLQYFLVSLIHSNDLRLETGPQTLKVHVIGRRMPTRWHARFSGALALPTHLSINSCYPVIVENIVTFN